MRAPKPISQCRICGNTELVPVVNLGEMALTGAFPRSRDEEVPRGPLELVKCVERGEFKISGTLKHDTCGLVQLRHSYDSSALYGASYGYRSGLNPVMIQHLNNIAQRAAELTKLDAHDFVLDIGSNDGTLLNAYSVGNKIGVDPTAGKFKQYYKPGALIVEDFFAGHVANNLQSFHPKIVTSIAMFYDLEDPLAFVYNIHEVLAPDGVWIFEQSYLPTMLSHLAYDTICHEHVEYYALHQVKWMLDRISMKIIDVELNDTNGGSFLVIAAHKEAPYPEAEKKIADVLAAEWHLTAPGTYREFAEHIAQHRDVLWNFVDAAWKLGHGPVFGYGASTKGNVVLQYCGFDASDISFIAERNEDKFGAFTPGTKIEIISEAAARKLDPGYFLVLPWHFKNAIIERERAYLDGGGKLVFALPSFTVVEEVP